MTAHPIDRLSDLLDASLDPIERAGIEAHLEGCDTCRALLADLTDVQARARRLPALPPAADLWPAIEARLDSESGVRTARVTPIEGARAPRGRDARWSFSFPQLAAAVLAATLVSAGGMWLMLQRGTPAGTASAPAGGSSAPLAAKPGSGAGSTGARTTTRPTPGSDVMPTSFDAAQYDAAIAELEQVLNQNKQRLDPATVKVVERNLALIDQAIEQARRALAADPASAYLNTHLASTMRRKVDLLRRVTSAVRI